MQKKIGEEWFTNLDIGLESIKKQCKTLLKRAELDHTLLSLLDTWDKLNASETQAVLKVLTKFDTTFLLLENIKVYLV